MHTRVLNLHIIIIFARRERKNILQLQEIAHISITRKFDII